MATEVVLLGPDSGRLPPRRGQFACRFEVYDEGVTTTLKPWSELLTVRWLPELQFYEQKTALIKRLRRDLDTSFFRIDPDDVAVLVPPHGDTVEVAFNSLRVRGFSQFLQEKQARRVLSTVLDLLHPELAGSVVTFQHVVPIGGEYSEVRQAAAARAIGLSLEGLRSTDFAILFDAEVREHEMSMQAEFGIVSKSELPERLARVIGRMRNVAESPGGPPPWLTGQDDADWPDVALFVDSHWTAEQRPAGPTDLEAIYRFWMSARQLAESTVENLRSGVLGQSG